MGRLIQWLPLMAEFTQCKILANSNWKIVELVFHRKPQPVVIESEESRGGGRGSDVWQGLRTDEAQLTCNSVKHNQRGPAQPPAIAVHPELDTAPLHHQLGDIHRGERDRGLMMAILTSGPRITAQWTIGIIGHQWPGGTFQIRNLDQKIVKSLWRTGRMKGSVRSRYNTILLHCKHDSNIF